MNKFQINQLSLAEATQFLCESPRRAKSQIVVTSEQMVSKEALRTMVLRPKKAPAVMPPLLVLLPREPKAGATKSCSEIVRAEERLSASSTQDLSDLNENENTDVNECKKSLDKVEKRKSFTIFEYMQHVTKEVF
eukprot:TRINITY_DN0_c3051_g1_i1.p2 TRINITY_DN0_c3051_g1~~TRINITY_DN0_c3051_g1_i1.p2  ORF type:complete len:135 (+),score=23.11 TRINITY_DN0_c3051_g1_i1:45-449(+)